MRLYLASPYGDRLKMKAIADQLTDLGFEITARWVYGEHDRGQSEADFRRYATEDWEDINKAQALVVFTPQDEHRRRLHPYLTTGGHHVETGIALATGKPVLLVGTPANVFHLLTEVSTVDEWGHEAITTLTAIKANFTDLQQQGIKNRHP